MASNTFFHSGLFYADALQDSRRATSVVLTDLTSGGTTYAAYPVANLLTRNINQLFKRTFSSGSGNDIRLQVTFSEPNSQFFPTPGALVFHNVRQDLNSSPNKLIRPAMNATVTIAINTLGTIVNAVTYQVNCGGPFAGTLAVPLPIFDAGFLTPPAEPWPFHANGGVPPGVKNWTIDIRIKNLAGLGALDFTAGRIMVMSVFPFKLAPTGVAYGVSDNSDVQWSYGRTPYANLRTPQRTADFTMKGLRDAQVFGGYWNPKTDDVSVNSGGTWLSTINAINVVAGSSSEVYLYPHHAITPPATEETYKIQAMNMYGLLQSPLKAVLQERKTSGGFASGSAVINNDGVWDATGSLLEIPGSL